LPTVFRSANRYCRKIDLQRIGKCLDSSKHARPDTAEEVLKKPSFFSRARTEEDSKLNAPCEDDVYKGSHPNAANQQSKRQTNRFCHSAAPIVSNHRLSGNPNRNPDA